MAPSTMTNADIKELIELVQVSGVAELEVQRGENRVRIRRGFTPADVSIAVPATLPMAMPLPATVAPPPSELPAAPSAVAPAANPAAPVATGATETQLLVIKSPIVGTYYDAPSPGSPPFVKIGDTVQPGQVLCIVESMKLMNEIEAEVSGVIVAKLIESGRAVEYGESLFTLRPA